jgi:peptidoglycan/xylan/chitin deacetylase (PgdA/CDA1 family)
MFGKNKSIINISCKRIFREHVFKNKNYLISLIVFLILILASYLIFHNLPSKKIAEGNIDNTNVTVTESHNSSTIQDINYLNKTESENNLVNDNIGVPVLYYHSVRDSADNEVTITPAMLKTELKYIKDEGYITLTLSELKSYILDNSPIPKKSIVITFDDGYMDNYYNAFPILKDLNMKATIFCITCELNGSYYLSKDVIVEMSNNGIDIQSHTVTHPKLDEMTYDKQLTELTESKKTLESITGKKVDSVAYPFGNFNNDSIKAAKEAGYTLGFTTKRGLSDRNDDPLKLDRIYISSKYDMNTFKEILNETKK